jgi:hypothetical protein
VNVQKSDFQAPSRGWASTATSQILHTNEQATRANLHAPLYNQASFTVLHLASLQRVTAPKTMHCHDHSYKITAPAKHGGRDGDPEPTASSDIGIGEGRTVDHQHVECKMRTKRTRRTPQIESTVSIPSPFLCRASKSKSSLKSRASLESNSSTKASQVQIQSRRHTPDSCTYRCAKPVDNKH